MMQETIIKEEIKKQIDNLKNEIEEKELIFKNLLEILDKQNNINEEEEL